MPGKQTLHLSDARHYNRLICSRRKQTSSYREEKGSKGEKYLAACLPNAIVETVSSDCSDRSIHGENRREKGTLRHSQICCERHATKEDDDAKESASTTYQFPLGTFPQTYLL
jgi:type VI protein secretion system component Hcp